MASSLEKPSLPSADQRRWLYVMRVAAAISMLPLCRAIFQTLAPGYRNPCADEPGPSLIVFVPLAMPYAHILFHLRAPRRPDKDVLALALLTCTIGFLIGVLGVTVSLAEREMSDVLFVGTFALSQAALAAS